MSMHRTILAVSALVLLAACGSGETTKGDSTAATPAAGATLAPASDATTPPAQPIDVMPGTAVPSTGAIIEVKMIGDAKGYRFEPQHVTAKVGDAVKFVVISGGPHEVAFDLNAVPVESRSQLQANMPNSVDGKSPLLAGEQETWTVSLGALKPGVYPFVSTPRLPQGMKGEIEIK